MSSHAPDHDELLQRILVGDLDSAQPPARERLRDCPECRDELERLRALDARLRAAAAQQAAEIAAARAEASPADEERLRRSLERALAARGRAAAALARRPSRFLALALAAGLLFVLGLAASRLLRARKAAAMPEILLGGAIPCTAPLGSVEDYDVFAWSYDLPPQGSFELRIHALEDDGAGDQLLVIPGLFTPRWTPGPREKSALPPAIYWEVRARDDARGTVLGTGWGKAWRRSGS